MNTQQSLTDFPIEMVLVSELKPHPRNYQEHPDDQIEHLIQSVEENTFYRNIVVARDGTILAGHGMWQATKRMGRERIPVIRLDIDPNSSQALKVMAGDNETSHLADRDDRLLTEMLKEIKDSADDGVDGLLGTGYDEMMLANLVYMTRAQDEIEDFDAAAHWVGMPEYDEGQGTLKIIVSFRNKADQMKFVRMLDLKFIGGIGKTRSVWWPHKEKGDPSSLLFEG